MVLFHRNNKMCLGFLSFVFFHLLIVLYFTHFLKKNYHFISLLWFRHSILWKSCIPFCSEVIYSAKCKILHRMHEIYWNWSSYKIYNQVLLYFGGRFTTEDHRGKDLKKDQIRSNRDPKETHVQFILCK